MSETNDPPTLLTRSLPRRDHAALERWWGSLPSAERSELRDLFDPRRERIGATATADGRWASLPIRLQGRTVEDRELGPETRQAKQQLLEFILNHEEIVFFLENREFHICRRHFQARTILEEGRLPAGFRCSHRGESCPMRAVSKAAREEPVLIEIRMHR